MISDPYLKDIKKCSECNKECALYSILNGKVYCAECFAKIRTSLVKNVQTLTASLKG